MKFGEPAPQSGAAASGKVSSPHPLALPAALPFKLLFAPPIDTETAAAGDRIKARLASAIRDASSETILVPQGSDVTARIVRLEHFPGPPFSVRMLVKLESVNVGGMPQPFTAIMSWAPLPRTVSLSGSWLQERTPLGSLDALSDPSVGIFDFRDVKPNFVVKSGLESNWTTAEPR
jgi:hypothetical protein